MLDVAAATVRVGQHGQKKRISKHFLKLNKIDRETAQNCGLSFIPISVSVPPFLPCSGAFLESSSLAE